MKAPVLISVGPVLPLTSSPTLQISWCALGTRSRAANCAHAPCAAVRTWIDMRFRPMMLLPLRIWDRIRLRCPGARGACCPPRRERPALSS
eukprot:4206086-Pleurochrysis_carterae.AAC.1